MALRKQLVNLRFSTQVLLSLAIPFFSACTTLQSGPGASLSDTRLLDGVSVLERSKVAFVADLSSSSTAPGDSHLANRAWLTGRAMLDLQCNAYLDALGLANQAASNERKQTGLIGGFVTGLMGLTGSAAKEVAGVATAFSFAGSSMDVFTSSYLFADAAKSVTKIVRESQAAYLGALSMNPDTITYPDMVAVLTSYEALCRPAQIRALIDEAVSKGKVVADFSTPTVSDGEVFSVLATLSTSFGRPISEVDAINLYAWYLYPQSRANGAKTGENEPIPQLLKAAKTPEQFTIMLTQAFLPISLAGSRIPARWAEAVKRVAAAPNASILNPDSIAAQQKSAAQTKSPLSIYLPRLSIR